MKKWFVVIGCIIILAVGWYLFSPAFTVVVAEDPNPLVDVTKDMDAETKKSYMDEMEQMKDTVMEMEEVMPDGLSARLEADFKPHAHEVSGSAFFIEEAGQRVLRFEDFDTINGPQLHIYLATDTSADDFVDLGKIKATRGDVNYNVPNDVDIEKYSHVLVWCKPFGVLFSYAELQ